MTTTQINTLKLIIDAILETVKEAGSNGAPGGVLYAALMAQGCSLNQFQSLMRGIVSGGKLRQDGDLYFIA
jgi:hypothetical protein